MKIKNVLTGTLLAGAMLLAATPSQAQFNLAANPDSFMPNPATGNSYNVLNTGNDARETLGKSLRVMTWDGDDPSFGWDWANGAVTGSDFIMAHALSMGTVTDPDLIIDPHNQGIVTIIYELDMGSGPEIWAESWKFNGSGMSFAFGPFQMDTPGNGPSSNPNIDTDIKTKHAVITFEQNGEIFGHAYDMYGSGPSNNIFNVSGGCLNNTNSQPDVAMFYDPNSGKSIVSFTFIHDNGSDFELTLIQETLTDVLYTPASGCGNYFIADALPNSDILENPRIAAPKQNVTSDPYDVYIVAHRNDGGSDLIMGYSKFAAVHGPGNFGHTKVNDVSSLYTCQNARPAVSFVGRLIVVAWTYQDASCGYIGTGDDEVLVRYLYFDGNYFYPDYSIANFDLPGNQFAASVAGRHNINLEALYTFYDDNYEFILYKSSWFTNQNLRKGLAAASKPGLSVYPMPVIAESELAYTIPKDETGAALELYSLTGQKVRSYNISGKTEGSYETGFGENTKGADLPAGMYMLRLSTNKSTQATRVIIRN